MNLMNGSLPSYLFDPETFASINPSKLMEQFPPAWQERFYNTNGLLYQAYREYVYPFITSEVGIAGLIGVTLLCVGWFWLHTTSRRGSHNMTQEQRQAYLDRLLSDAICDAVEDLRYKDMISYQEKRHMYKRFAKALHLPDLVPVHKNKVKNQVKNRLGNGVYKTKPEIPGDKPMTMEEIKAKAVKKKPVPKRSLITQAIASQKTAAA